MENGSEVLNRKDQGYASEVNSCDSNHEIVSLHDEIIPGINAKQTVNMEKEIALLKRDLEKTKLDLQQKTVECEEISILKNKVESELLDLTTSLFEEANKMVYEANLKQDRAEKKLAVAEGQIDALETEVTALKSIVITSTPSNPNPKSHPQLIKKNESSPIRAKILKNNVFDHFKTEPKKTDEFHVENDSSSPHVYLRLNKDIDEVLFNQLKSWRSSLSESTARPSGSSSSFCGCEDTSSVPLNECPVLSKSEFLSRISTENIFPCLDFANKEMAAKVSICVHKNLLSVESTNGNTKHSKQICALSKTRSICKHRIRFSDEEPWHSISQTSRNRIISVCNFFTYLRYIRQGIVKSSVEQVYWEIINHRLEISFALSGYNKEQS